MNTLTPTERARAAAERLVEEIESAPCSFLYDRIPARILLRRLIEGHPPLPGYNELDDLSPGQLLAELRTIHSRVCGVKE